MVLFSKNKYKIYTNSKYLSDNKSIILKDKLFNSKVNIYEYIIIRTLYYILSKNQKKKIIQKIKKIKTKKIKNANFIRKIFF